jgi:hypothetical protein
MLDLDTYKWRSKTKEGFKEQSAKVLDFQKKWKSYDFTK